MSLCLNNNNNTPNVVTLRTCSAKLAVKNPDFFWGWRGFFFLDQKKSKKIRIFCVVRIEKNQKNYPVKNPKTTLKIQNMTLQSKQWGFYLLNSVNASRWEKYQENRFKIIRDLFEKKQQRESLTNSLLHHYTYMKVLKATCSKEAPISRNCHMLRCICYLRQPSFYGSRILIKMDKTHVHFTYDLTLSTISMHICNILSLKQTTLIIFLKMNFQKIQSSINTLMFIFKVLWQ